MTKKNITKHFLAKKLFLEGIRIFIENKSCKSLIIAIPSLTEKELKILRIPLVLILMRFIYPTKI